MSEQLVTILARAKALHETQYDKGFFWSDKYAYCSELVWKAFDSAHLSFGDLPKMSKYVENNEDSERIKAKLEAVKHEYRDDKGYDPDESAVSPEDIYTSPALLSVTDNTP